MTHNTCLVSLLLTQGGKSYGRRLGPSFQNGTVPQRLVRTQLEQAVGEMHGEMELMNSLVLFYVHGWLNPFIAQPALIQDPALPQQRPPPGSAAPRERVCAFKAVPLGTVCEL